MKQKTTSACHKIKGHEIKRHKRKRHAHGFTLVELLVVLAIIGILAALIFPAVRGALKKAKITRAKVEVNAIAAAVEAYYADYGRLPIPDYYQGRFPYFFSIDYVKNSTPSPGVNNTNCSMYVFQIITANDTDENGDTTLPDDFGQIMNPKKIAYLEPQTSSDLNDMANGVYEDPWGVQYLFNFDSGYDGRTEFFSGGSQSGIESIQKSVIVYSIGPDSTNIPPDDTILPNIQFPDFISSSYH